MNITINDIVALSNAGFTKAEILALTAQPTVAQPTVAQPTVAQPTVAQPTVAQPTVVQPTVAQPTVVQPTVAQPTVAQPTVAQPTVAQPTVAQPSVAQTDNGVSMSNAQFTALLQSINAGNASIDLPPTYDINNVLADHYKTLMVGDSQKKGE